MTRKNRVSVAAAVVLAVSVRTMAGSVAPVHAILPSAIPVSGLDTSSHVSFVSDDGKWIASAASPTSFLRNRFTGESVEVPGAMEGMSGDARFVVFITYQALVPSDTVPNSFDVYRLDRITGQYLRVAAPASPYFIADAEISNDGAVVFYEEKESMPNPRSRLWRVVVGGPPVAVPITGGGLKTFWINDLRNVSADGRYATYLSSCTAATTCTTSEVRRFDRTTGFTAVVSVNSSGVESNALDVYGDMSPSGRYVLFGSAASNLGVPTGFPAWWFVRDVVSNTTTTIGERAHPLAAVTDTGLVTFSSYVHLGGGAVREVLLAHDLATGARVDIGTTPRFAALTTGIDAMAYSADGLRAIFSTSSRDVLPGAVGSMFIADLDGQLTAPPATTRLLDTRSAVGIGTTTPVPAGQEVVVQVVGRAGILAGTSALHVNLAIVQPSGPGFAKVYPCDEPPESVSSINFAAMTTTTNAAMVKVSQAGTVCVTASTTTHVVVDFQRAVTAFTVISPVRLLNTREPVESPTPLAADETRTLRVGGANGVELGSEGVALSVTIVDPTTNGFLRAFPCGSPTTLANMNFSAGLTKASLVVATPNAEGDVCFQSSSAAHLVVDLVAHLPVESNYVPLPGTRLVGAAEGPVRGGRVLRVFVPRVVFGHEIVALGIVAVQPARPGYVAAFTCGTNIPLTSTLNFVPGRATSNLLFVQKGGYDDVCMYVSQDVTLVVDHYSSTLW